MRDTGKVKPPILTPRRYSSVPGGPAVEDVDIIKLKETLAKIEGKMVNEVTTINRLPQFEKMAPGKVFSRLSEPFQTLVDNKVIDYDREHQIIHNLRMAVEHNLQIWAKLSSQMNDGKVRIVEIRDRGEKKWDAVDDMIANLSTLPGIFNTELEEMRSSAAVLQEKNDLKMADLAKIIQEIGDETSVGMMKEEEQDLTEELIVSKTPEELHAEAPAVELPAEAPPELPAELPAEVPAPEAPAPEAPSPSPEAPAEARWRLGSLKKSAMGLFPRRTTPHRGGGHHHKKTKKRRKTHKKRSKKNLRKKSNKRKKHTRKTKKSNRKF